MSAALIALVLGLGAVAGAFIFAGWLFRRQERRLDAQLAAEMAKLQEIIRAVADHASEVGAVEYIDTEGPPKLDADDPSKAILDGITLRAKKKPN